MVAALVLLLLWVGFELCSLAFFFSSLMGSEVEESLLKSLSCGEYQREEWVYGSCRDGLVVVPWSGLRHVSFGLGNAAFQ